jgi:dihydroneopterin triphosphate diphosphatase
MQPEPSERPRRPESVLIVIYTVNSEFLLIERRKPPGFWQSVTGSLEWGESPQHAAAREVLEETGITDGELTDLHLSQTYEIWPSFGRVYAPGITHNLEHAFALRLAGRVPVTLSAREHAQFLWLSAAEAFVKVSSETNRAAIKRLM